MKDFLKKILKKFKYKVIKKDEFSSLEIIKNLFDKKSEIIIFDIGAHNGQSTKNYRNLFKNAMIYAFEPSSESYKVLSSLKINKFKAFNIGFSNKQSKEKLLVNSEKTTTNSLLPFSSSAKKVWGLDSLSNTEIIFCSFNTIDNFLNEEKITFIDFMKIDVQGAEYLVLDGAKEALLKKKIKVIQLEVIFGDTYVGQKSIGFYINLLESYGYKFKNFTDNIVINGKLIQSDLFFSI